MPIVVVARRCRPRKVRTVHCTAQSLIGVAAQHANKSNVVDLLAFQPSFDLERGKGPGLWLWPMGAEQLARRRFSEPGISVSVPFLIVPS